MKGRIFVNQAFGVENIVSMKNIFSIFPNPSRGKFRIDFESEKSGLFKKLFLKVYQNQGNIVYTKNFQLEALENEIDLSALSSGIYFIAIIAENKIYSTKIVLL